MNEQRKCVAHPRNAAYDPNSFGSRLLSAGWYRDNGAGINTLALGR